MPPGWPRSGRPRRRSPSRPRAPGRSGRIPRAGQLYVGREARGNAELLRGAEAGAGDHAAQAGRVAPSRRSGREDEPPSPPALPSAAPGVGRSRRRRGSRTQRGGGTRRRLRRPRGALPLRDAPSAEALLRPATSSAPRRRQRSRRGPRMQRTQPESRPQPAPRSRTVPHQLPSPHTCPKPRRACAVTRGVGRAAAPRRPARIRAIASLVGLGRSLVGWAPLRGPGVGRRRGAAVRTTSR